MADRVIQMKTCPYCAESILPQAVKCKHCGMMLHATGRTPADTLDIAKTLPLMTIFPGKLLAERYRIERHLGGGGMGEVWQACDTELDDMAMAIKVLPAELARHQRSVDALKREAAIALRLTHGSIRRLHHFHSQGEIKFLVMEYIDGETLEERLDGLAERRMTFEQVLPIARQIADGLDYAHTLQPPILHRDIKPSNIMVTRSDTALLVDFGIARELKDSLSHVTGGQTSGTLLYMSPEQFAGQSPGVASDVYSFAATVYHCLAGHAPFYQGALGHQILHAAPAELAHVPAHVNTALQLGLAKSVDERPRSAGELIRLLEQPEACQEYRTTAPVQVAQTDDDAVSPETQADQLLAEARDIATKAGINLGNNPRHLVSERRRAAARRGLKRVRAALRIDPQSAVALVMKERFEAWSRLPSRLSINLSGALRMQLVLVQPGSFIMGTSESAAGFEDARPAHEVRIGRTFYIGRTPVTQAQWLAVMPDNPSRFRGDELPVESISWHACQAFCEQLNSQTALRVRLPSEAEWEYACRALAADRDSDNPSADLDARAWHAENSTGRTQVVGQKRANRWGLHDMLGNVWEWCLDWYAADYYTAGPQEDPAGPEQGVARVLRGGSWACGAGTCRAARRGFGMPHMRTMTTGLRVVVQPP